MNLSLRLHTPFSVACDLQGVLVCKLDADILLLEAGKVGVDLPTLLVLDYGELCPECALTELSLVVCFALSGDVRLDLSLALTIGCALSLNVCLICFASSLNLRCLLSLALSLDLCLALRLAVDLAD